MKKFAPLLFGFSFLFFSCATAMVVDKPTKLSQPKSLSVDFTSEMEFIGFYGSASNLPTSINFDSDIVHNSQYDCWSEFSKNSSIEKFGYELENIRLASDKSQFYLGNYDLIDLNNYKTQSHYVSFVKVTRNSLAYNERKGYISAGILGAIGVDLGAGLLIWGNTFDKVGAQSESFLCTVSGAVLMACGGLQLIMAAANGGETKFIYDGNFEIYIYDTIEKKFVSKDVVTINFEDSFKGIYTHSETNATALDDYYASKISSEILKKYGEVVRKINHIAYDKIGNDNEIIDEAINKFISAESTETKKTSIINTKNEIPSKPKTPFQDEKNWRINNSSGIGKGVVYGVNKEGELFYKGNTGIANNESWLELMCTDMTNMYPFLQTDNGQNFNVKFKARGDGNTYSINFRMKNGTSYKYCFKTTKGETVDVFAPYSKFQHVSWSPYMKLDLSKVEVVYFGYEFGQNKRNKVDFEIYFSDFEIN